MLICIDYDGTFTEDTDLWTKFIEMAKEKQHTVVCATMRHESEAEGMDAISSLCDVVFTSRNAKQPFLAALDIVPDIWIDDSPWWLYNNG